MWVTPSVQTIICVSRLLESSNVLKICPPIVRDIRWASVLPKVFEKPTLRGAEGSLCTRADLLVCVALGVDMVHIMV
jgi:hypothetical protein